jgi:hypothetical protein
MLGLIWMYFIGNAFYKLAELHQKSKWGFAIVGVLSYYVGMALFVGIAVIYLSLTDINAFESTPEYMWDLIGIPIGLLSCWGLYRLLKNQWSKPQKVTGENILDADLIN